MVGPNYVFMFEAAYYETYADPPAFAASWCTKDMIMEVLNGSIISESFTTSLKDVYGPRYREMTGSTYDQYYDIASAKLENPMFVSSFFTRAYDRMLVILTALNQTELLLNQGLLFNIMKGGFQVHFLRKHDSA